MSNNYKDIKPKTKLPKTQSSVLSDYRIISYANGNVMIDFFGGDIEVVQQGFQSTRMKY